MFDINAPLERQRTRDGRKVLKITDSGLPIDCPIVAWLEGDNRAYSFSQTGSVNLFSNLTDRRDILTLPEPLPLIVSYLNVYDEKDIGVGCKSLGEAHMAKLMTSTIEVTYDPNTGESSAKTVWRKGESA